MEELIVNFADVRERANFRRMVDTLDGLKRVTIKAYRRTRTSQQNRYLWGVVYPAFVQFRQEQGEEFDTAMAHDFFKLKFLRQTVVNKETGEVLGTTVPSTTKLNTAEMAEYIDKIVAWCADYGISVPPASMAA